MNGRSRTLLGILSILAFSVGLVSVSVPLYRLFCQETGYVGDPRQVASNTSAVPGANVGKIVVRFDTNVMPGMPWRFYAKQGSMEIKLGETNLALFGAENTSKEPIVGTAVFNVTPFKAAPYVNKIQCFCFTQQRLEPGEKAELPVSFYIDPKIATNPDTNDVGTITLSYTFYKARNQEVGSASAPLNTSIARGDKGS